MQSEQYVINVDSYMKFSSVKGVEKYIHLQNNPKISEWKQGSGKNVDTKTFFHRCKICTKGVHVTIYLKISQKIFLFSIYEASYISLNFGFFLSRPNWTT